MPTIIDSQVEQFMPQPEVDFLFESMVAAEFPAENEIYGRSLSTIRRLGAFMIDKTHQETISSPEADQARVEFFTSVEEGFGTDVELGGGLEVRDFDERNVLNGRVVAKDLKTAISSMTKAGLDCAEETLKQDTRFLPQYVRSVNDHENALIVDAMARGETGYNTRIVISPFPEEAALQSGNDYWRNIGYVPHLRRGFVQLYHITPDGVLVSGSLSFDGSDKHQLKELQSRLGIQIPEGESTDNWLKYAYTGTLTEVAAKELSTEIANKVSDPNLQKNTNTVDVTHAFKPLMDRVFNESYIHVCESLARGQQTSGVKKLIQELFASSQSFNDRYAEALLRMRVEDRFTENDSVILHELLVYSTIEMMRSLHLSTSARSQKYAHIGFSDAFNMAEQLRMVDATSFQKLLSGFGAEGAKNNRTYSACGLSISAGGEDGENDPQGAFGGHDKEKEKNKWMNCPHCKALVYDDPCAKFLMCFGCKSYVLNGVTHESKSVKKKQELLKLEANEHDTKRIESQEQIGSMALQNSQVAVAA